MSIFPVINHINDILPHINHKEEIKVMHGYNDTKIICYMFADAKTFENPYLRECRGITFDRNGNIISRNLHKFYNIGEKTSTFMENLDFTKVIRHSTKMDGSMICTVWMDGALHLKSKQSFTSDVIHLAWQVMNNDHDLKTFSTLYSCAGYTCIFEITSPMARIVLPYEKTELTLLHIRHNITGEYLNLNSIKHEIKEFGVRTVQEFDITKSLELVNGVESLTDVEGYVIQFQDGDMVKAKCKWYRNLHRSVTMLRERDIVQSVLDENLDDIKSALRKRNINMDEIEQIEHTVVQELIDIRDVVEIVSSEFKQLSRKDFAIKFKDHQYFSLLMKQHLGEEPDYKLWYEKNVLKNHWTVRVISGIEDSDN